MDAILIMEANVANEELRQQIDQLNRDMGIGPVAALDPNLRGAGDIFFIAKSYPVWMDWEHLEKVLTALKNK